LYILPNFDELLDFSSLLDFRHPLDPGSILAVIVIVTLLVNSGMMCRKLAIVLVVVLIRFRILANFRQLCVFHSFLQIRWHEVAESFE
jgi:hypothetical protein